MWSFYLFKNVQLGRYFKAARINPKETDMDSTAISGVYCGMNFFELLPNLSFCLMLSLTIYVSVASCEGEKNSK